MLAKQFRSSPVPRRGELRNFYLLRCALQGVESGRLLLKWRTPPPSLDSTTTSPKKRRGVFSKGVYYSGHEAARRRPRARLPNRGITGAVSLLEHPKQCHRRKLRRAQRARPARELDTPRPSTYARHLRRSGARISIRLLLPGWPYQRGPGPSRTSGRRPSCCDPPSVAEKLRTSLRSPGR